MSAMAAQITSLTTVYSTVYSAADQRKHQSSAWLVNSTHKWPVTRKMFPVNDDIMETTITDPYSREFDFSVKIQFDFVVR